MADRPVPAKHWGPRPVGIIGCAVGGALLLAAAQLMATDPPGRVLAGLAGAGLLVFAAGSWRARPKLAITEAGLVHRGWWRTQVWTAEQLGRIRITEFRRIGRRVRLLEIETVDEQLLVLSRWDLGVDPLDVLDALTTAGYAGR